MKNIIIALITCLAFSAVAFADETAPATSAPAPKHSKKMKKHKKKGKKEAAESAPAEAGK